MSAKIELPATTEAVVPPPLVREREWTDTTFGGFIFLSFKYLVIGMGVLLCLTLMPTVITTGQKIVKASKDLSGVIKL